MSGVVPAGTVQLDPADAALGAWAVGELIRVRTVRREAIPSELVRLNGVLRAAVGAAVGSASTQHAGPVAAALSTPDGLTVTEVAHMIERSPGRVRQLVADGTLPARRAGRRTLLVDPGGVAGYLSRRQAVA